MKISPLKQIELCARGECGVCPYRNPKQPSADECEQIITECIEKLSAYTPPKIPSKGGRPPYGYTSKWEIVDEEATMIRDIYALAQKGMRKTDITRRMNDSGLRTRVGSPFSQTTITNILNNEHIYRGKEGHHEAIL